MQKVVWTQGAKVSEKSFAPPKTPFCTGAKRGFGWCKRLFGDLCSLGPKDLLHYRMQLFCLQLEASWLTVELFYLQLTILAFLLTVRAFWLTALAF